MKDKTFEEAIKELEDTVQKLETGLMDLEGSISLYQRGLDLYKFCFQKLQEAEKLIVKINEDKKGE